MYSPTGCRGDFMNTQQNVNNKQIEAQNTKNNPTSLPDSTPVLSRRKKRRISAGW